jgi:hypothetical protein
VVERAPEEQAELVAQAARAVRDETKQRRGASPVSGPQSARWSRTKLYYNLTQGAEGAEIVRASRQEARDTLRITCARIKQSRI